MLETTVIKKDILVQILNYLGSKPWTETNPLIQKILKEPEIAVAMGLVSPPPAEL